MMNIPSYCEDPSYRYKMPKMVCRIEGRGNGIKTSVTNLADVCRSIKRSPTHLVKFFGCELGAQSKWEKGVDKATVNGEHSGATLQSQLDKFIESFVLCRKCKLPEVDMSVSKEKLVGKCNACGWSGALDNAHKVASFMVKNFETGCSTAVTAPGGAGLGPALGSAGPGMGASSILMSGPSIPAPTVKAEKPKKDKADKEKADKADKADKVDKDDKPKDDKPKESKSKKSESVKSDTDKGTKPQYGVKTSTSSPRGAQLDGLESKKPESVQAQSESVQATPQAASEPLTRTDSGPAPALSPDPAEEKKRVSKVKSLFKTQ